MTEPQVWTLIGVFAASLFGVLTVMSTMFVRILRTEIGGVRTELESVRTEMRTEFQSVRTEMRAEIGGIRTEIGGIHSRLDRLDADVNALMKHAFGIDRG
ncbi:hypothetical protein [Microbacterium sp.]|uniref:hypothetical protein n=1 Tax=Microbacterium sp. TaxID=51671 RepID=UPI0039E71EBC